MCAIIDAKVVAEAFGAARTPTGHLSPPGSGHVPLNDQHVIALAQVSGARLLFGNDPALHSDFKNKQLVDSPRGKVYSTKESPTFTKSHKRLLRDRTLCSRPP